MVLQDHLVHRLPLLLALDRLLRRLDRIKLILVVARRVHLILDLGLALLISLLKFVLDLEHLQPNSLAVLLRLSTATILHLQLVPRFTVKSATGVLLAL